jgi:hypothetical protein
MSTINPTAATSNFIGNGDFTWWLGTVLNADDKDAKIGRVKVNILGFHRPQEKPENLPWAHVMAPTDSAGANGVGSAGNQLKPGSFVVGFFLDYPDCQQPVVMGTLLSKITGVYEPNSQERLDYPTGFPNSIQNFNSDSSDRGQSRHALAGKDATVSQTVAAAAAPHSAANPSGAVKDIPIADGKNAGEKTLDSNLSYAVGNIVTTVAQLKLINKNASTKLSVDIDAEEQTIPVEDTSKFPVRGILQVGSEKIAYNNKGTKKFVLAKRGALNTNPSKHDRRTVVTLIPKSEVIGGTSEATSEKGDVMGTFVDNLVDLKKVIDTNLEFIKDSLWWLVNEIKSFLMSQITRILNAIGLSAISPVPFFGKLLTDVIILILREIACIFEKSLIDALFSVIEDAIMSVVDRILDAIEAVQCIFDSIFSSIFGIFDLVSSIVDMVSDIVSAISSVGDITNISSDTQLNVTGILDFILSLLGIGCNKDTRDPLSLTFSSCPIASLANCSPQNLFDVQLQGIPGRWNPEYSKIMGTFSENGSMFAIDDTTYSSNMEIRHGPSKSGITIQENGDVKITNSSGKVEVTIKDEEIVVHGNYKVTVDGDYHLKVGRDMHVEVLGMYNLSVNRESKVTYAGEHNCYYKNDAKLEANNGLALVASKLGISCSGQYQLNSPILTTVTTEQNHVNAGSWNLYSTFQNDFIATSAFKIVGLTNVFMDGGINTQLTAGQYFEGTGGSWSGIKLGISDETTIGTENAFSLGVRNTSVFGLDSSNKLSSNFENVTGTNVENIFGAGLKTLQGFNYEGTAGLRCTSSGGFTLHT